MEQNLQEPKIINWPKKFLTTQTKILARGLKSTPISRSSNPNEIKINTMNFCNKLHLTEALHNYTSEDASIVKNKVNTTLQETETKH